MGESCMKSPNTMRQHLFKDLCELVKEQSDAANIRDGLLASGHPCDLNQIQSVVVAKRKLDSEYATTVSFTNTTVPDVP
ncbi:unnamed protein product [Schistosoma mattheei]|uniref:Uncharacterized protein n=1 Tax=Schistosoma mattheei TaxID=31246 RepID=A0A183P509_9TREM|nr:unnamed protein product [Schistosoma mattheei]